MDSFVNILGDIFLTEDDVPGASLGKRSDRSVRELHELCVPELKLGLLVVELGDQETKLRSSIGKPSLLLFILL